MTCVCVHGDTNACVCMYMDISLRCGSSGALSLFAETGSHWLGQAGQPQVPGICSTSLAVGLHVCTTTQLFYMCSKEQIQVSIFVKKLCID